MFDQKESEGHEETTSGRHGGGRNVSVVVSGEILD